MLYATKPLSPVKALTGPSAKKVGYLELASSKWRELEQKRVAHRLSIDTQSIQWVEAVRRANVANKRLFEQAVAARKIYYFIRSWKEQTLQQPEAIKIPVTVDGITHEIVISTVNEALDYLATLG